MRIDYSPPRRSSTPPLSVGKQRSTGGSPLRFVMLIASLGLMLFGIGFGSGWYLSQQSTKQAFRAAMEQQSLESTPKEERQPPAPLPVAAPVPVAASTQPVTAAAPASAPQPTPSQQKSAVSAAPAGQPLTFYENLPSGQKNAVLGSGINEKPKPVAAPAPPPQPAVTPAQKPVTETQAAAVKPPPAPTAPVGWLVQVAAFSSQKEAETLKTKLAAKGYNASIMETHLNDKGTWYRVRIGRHMSKDAAQDIASRIGGGAKALPDQE